MAKGRSGHRPGGGIASRVNVEKPVKFGEPAHRKRTEGVSRIGQMVGNKTTEGSGKLHPNVEKVEGGVMGGVGSVELGNECARNVGKGGPGTGRKLYGQSGTNKCY